jgi:hypothetical protein
VWYVTKIISLGPSSQHSDVIISILELLREAEEKITQQLNEVTANPSTPELPSTSTITDLRMLIAIISSKF